ncbi:MAG: hypothetical protein FJ042_04265 [Candidatus Cloacimonetes bacterium]|nr:hypothetical protein [Candidatus Cloacimonadota bacterium]
MNKIMTGVIVLMLILSACASNQGKPDSRIQETTIEPLFPVSQPEWFVNHDPAFVRGRAISIRADYIRAEEAARRTASQELFKEIRSYLQTVSELRMNQAERTEFRAETEQLIERFMPRLSLQNADYRKEYQRSSSTSDYKCFYTACYPISLLRQSFLSWVREQEMTDKLKQILIGAFSE